MTYIPAYDSSDDTGKVVYESKDAKTSKTFDALDWFAQLVTHIPKLTYDDSYYQLLSEPEPL
jgi:hypothetical protein